LTGKKNARLINRDFHSKRKGDGLSTDEIDREQEYVSMLYGRLDGLRRRTATRLAAALRSPAGGTHQARTERDAAVAEYTEQLAQLNAVESRLCFGRLDFHDRTTRYIGRLGIFDETDGYEPLLLDWRAPASRPFYIATAASPEGVRRRRHIATKNRDVTSLDDEVLDLASADVNGRTGLTGESALLAALNASRTGRMGDIVETIQAEQDRIIRSRLDGVLVVEGGPGTGKTAVALHRAAFLLYTHRRELSRRGVLVVGPNATFLRYIGAVLPSLGETSVLLSTVGDLYPGISAGRDELPTAAAVKGSRAMAGVLAAAVADRQRLPEEGYQLSHDRQPLWLSRYTCEQARRRARLSRQPHNEARQIFAQEVVDALSRQVAERIGADPYADDPLGGDDAPGAGSSLVDDVEAAEIRRDIEEDSAVRAAIDDLWPLLTPPQLLDELFSSAERLASAAPDLSEAERALLNRSPGGGWTAADVPLLDEAAELLGTSDSAALALAERQRRARIAEAQGVLDILAGSAAHELDDPDPEVLMAYDLIDADRLGERHEERVTLTVAERAATDRSWTFGHIIVDEAQELSEMAWRMLMRRCPSRSMTIVGDVAQTGSLAGTQSWQHVLQPYLEDRWRLSRLTVNYRVPAEIMALASGLVPDVEAPHSVRETGVSPWQVTTLDLTATLPGIVAREAERIGDGRLAVLVPTSRLEELGRVVTAGVAGAVVGEDPDLERPVVVLDVKRAKGLEFDSVIVVDPGRIVVDSPRGRNDLYVALTRSTQRLGVVSVSAA
jgi:DNA helicase IV